jgi:starch-binding outer membrane protein, SusD/RagB family
MKFTKYIRVFIVLVTFAGVTACDDLLDFKPGNEIIADDAIQNVQDLQDLLNAAYDVLRGSGGNFLGGRFQTISEVMGDNIDGKPGSLNNADLLAYYNKTSSFFTGYTQQSFSEPYITIYRANVLLENIGRIQEITQAQADRLRGEALFLRAICHFELVKMFAHPYGTTADNSHLGIVLRTSAGQEARDRNTVFEVYKSIVDDLDEAKDLIPTSNGNYATSWAAKSYLAKVYFHMHRFQDAFNLANDVIENGPALFNASTDEFTERFSPGGSQESLFRIVSTPNDHRGAQFSFDYRTDTENIPNLRISRSLYNLSTSNPNDYRGQNWYTIENEGLEDERISLKKFDDKLYFDVALMHLTEVKFIRAESATELEQFDIALEDINDIRQRAGLNPTSSNTDKNTLLQVIRDEKRKELVAEGHRFHDLRRRGALRETDLLIRNSPWNCPGMSIQFPDGEIAGAGGVGSFTPNEEGGC